MWLKLAAVLLSGCTAVPPADVPAPATSGPLQVEFVVGGGCYDTAAPDCPEFTVELDGPDAEVVRSGLGTMRQVPDGDTGCGGEYVDGVSVRAVVEGATVCLSNQPDSDAAARVLRAAFAAER